MRYFGVVYDVGWRVLGEGDSSVEPFDPAVARYDMRVIADELHANAVRIEGEDFDRLRIASYAAHEAGLAVWFSPWKMNVGLDETTAYLIEAAKIAEQLKRDGAEVVFVTGCEYSIFNDGIYPGNNVFERTVWVKERLREHGWPNTPEGLPDPLPEKAKLLNEALRSLADTVRTHFSGSQVYSAAIFEEVDWTIFDYAGPNYYRETQTDEEYRAGLDYFSRFGRPIAIPEIGCCTYEGAAELGARGWHVFEEVASDGSAIFQDGVIPKRSETEQADYAERQLRFYTDNGVDAAFVFIFNQPSRPTGEGAKDLDLGSYSLVKYYAADHSRSSAMPPWERKEAFSRVAEVFQQFRAQQSDLKG